MYLLTKPSHPLFVGESIQSPAHAQAQIEAYCLPFVGKGRPETPETVRTDPDAAKKVDKKLHKLEKEVKKMEVSFPLASSQSRFYHFIHPAP
jgi:hypothetical protein